MKRRVTYGVANYAELVRKNGYFVDKTEYLAKLELIENPVFLRPRRFGKSLLCSMQEYYYGLKYASQFERLFGHTWIGQHPTENRNQFVVVSFDFSCIRLGANVAEIELSFNQHCNACLRYIQREYSPWLDEMPPLIMADHASANLDMLLHALKAYNLPPLYIIIDEYDNFTNQLITAHHDQLYYELTADHSFLKTFFKTLKEGRKTGLIANVFITGVLPITIDDLASGFNIANIITLDPRFEQMLGFTQAEVTALLDQIYTDYKIDPTTRPTVETVIKNEYNGYHFLNTNGESLYNSTILMYFLEKLCAYGTIPEYLTDLNLKTDLSWVKRITGSTPTNTEEFVDQLVTENLISYNKNYLISKFNMSTFFQKDFFPISFYYLGMLTKASDFEMRLPNLNMRGIFMEYFNELHQLDVSTKYAEMMQSFLDKPDLPKLFADYWRLYISQLPEAIFQKVNENFYLTTFYSLCSQYLSQWFVWNVERSYPQGKSDLEFVGKYHERHAALRYVIEFKYYSKLEFKKFKTTLESFQLQAEDTAQIAGYVQGLQLEYPEARISQFVIYCVGHQGFRIFEIKN